MDPKDRAKLRMIRENTGLNWVQFIGHIVGMLDGVKDLDDFMDIKNKIRKVNPHGKS